MTQPTDADLRTALDIAKRYCGAYEGKSQLAGDIAQALAAVREEAEALLAVAEATEQEWERRLREAKDRIADLERTNQSLVGEMGKLVGPKVIDELPEQGLAIVPVEPTEEMVLAGGGSAWVETCRMVWKRMVRAARESTDG